MIITVTPNPSIDRTLHIRALERGAFIRATAATAEAGGKGINVAACLATQGADVKGVLPAADSSAALLTRLLGVGPELVAVPVTGELRTNVSIVEPDGTVTKVNEPGAALGPGEEEALLARVAALASPGDWVAGCGSLPPGMDPGFYARLRCRLPPGARLAVDADGAALAACLGDVDLIKPNRRELEEATGRTMLTLGDVADAAAALVAGGARTVLVSLGPDGALIADAHRAWHAEAGAVTVVNDVGAGDALLAGCLSVLAGPSAGDGSDPVAAVRRADATAWRDAPTAADRLAAALVEGVAWSVAAVGSAGTRMRPVVAADRASVVLQPEVDRARRLAA